jgi:AcrR family transcriptional regulator
MPSATPVARLDAARARRGKGERTAQRILDAAERLFAEKGYAGTTLRDVAERAGLRIPSLYNHFASKDSLYAAVLERGIGPVFALLSEMVVEGEAARADSARVVERVMALLAQRPNLARLVQHETLAGGQHLTPLLRDWIVPVFARAAEVTAAAAGRGRWQPEQIPLLVLALYHVVVGYFGIAPFYRGLEGEDLLARDALARQTRFVVELVERLYAEPPSAAAAPGSSTQDG